MKKLILILSSLAFIVTSYGKVSIDSQVYAIIQKVAHWQIYSFVEQVKNRVLSSSNQKKLKEDPGVARKGNFSKME